MEKELEPEIYTSGYGIFDICWFYHANNPRHYA